MSTVPAGNSDRLVWGQGPSPCPYFILGEAPGATEDEEGIPFVGDSGRLLNEALEAAGVSRSDVYVTNAYKLRPENNRTPDEWELMEHAPLLAEELRVVMPNNILTLGNVATGAMTGEFTGITQKRGSWLRDADYFSGFIMPTYHPSYVLRQGGRESFAGGEFFRDVASYVAGSR